MPEETLEGLMGEFYLNLGRLNEAEAAFRRVGDVGGLRALEKAYLGNGEFTKALACRQALGEDWTSEEKVEIGHKLLRRGQLRGAEEAFTATNDIPGLIALGKSFVTGNQLGEAMRVFNLAKSREDLSSVGKAYLALNQLPAAHRAFLLAEDHESLQAVVVAYLFSGKLDSAKCLARKIVFDIGEELLIEAGWHEYREQHFSSSAVLFLEARCVRGLKAAAEKLLGEDNVEAATRIAEDILGIIRSR